MSGYLDL